MKGYRRYYCSIFYVMLRYGLVLSLVIASIRASITLSAYNLQEIPLVAIYGWLIFGLIFSFISISVYILAFPVRIGPQGIIGHTTRGRKYQLAWADTVYGGKFSTGGLPCHRLQSKTEPEKYVVLPNFLTSFARCKQELRRYGVDLDKEPTIIKPRVAKAAMESPQLVRTKVEPIREGAYIIVTTERQSERKLSS